MKTEYKNPKEMSKKELKGWKMWALNEILEYEQLVETLEKELSKRK